MEDITLHKKLAEQSREIRRRFLNEREAELETNVRAKKRAEPLVKPLVEAIEKKGLEPASTALPEAVLKRLIDDVEPFPEKRRIKDYARRYYERPELFNVMLTLARLKRLGEPPILSMLKHGVIDSLLFYGQGGTNLGDLPVRRLSPAYSERLASFERFYQDNYRNIESAQEKKDLDESELAETIEQELDEPHHYSSPYLRKASQALAPALMPSLDETSAGFQSPRAEEDTVDDFFSPQSGEGLKERLNLLLSARNAGNTSLDIANEASAILKTLLKRGKLSKSLYANLTKKLLG